MAASLSSIGLFLSFDFSQGISLLLLCHREFRRLRAAGRVPPCGAGSFSPWKRNQKTLGAGAIGGSAARLPPPCRLSPRTPITGVTPSSLWYTSGAWRSVCVSALYSGPTGPWAGGKLQVLRSRSRACVFRANAPGADYAVGAGDCKGCPCRVVRTCAKSGSHGRPGVPPLRKAGNVPGYAVPLNQT